MSKKERFNYFDAFFEMTEVARRESKALVSLFENDEFCTGDELIRRLAEMHQIENDGDEIARHLMEHLTVEFMPPIDHEDVTELVALLDDVTDLLEEVAQHVYMYNITEVTPFARDMANIIDHAVEALSNATKMFREFKKHKKLDASLEEVSRYEFQADALYIDAKRDVFVNHADASAAYLIAWNGLYSHMEQCCDACQDAAYAMRKIALKNT